MHFSKKKKGPKFHNVFCQKKN